MKQQEIDIACLVCMEKSCIGTELAVYCGVNGIRIDVRGKCTGREVKILPLEGINVRPSVTEVGCCY